MPFLRFSRDRRGYESTYLLHSTKRQPGQAPSRLLYWFRTPPHIKIGRAAFDEDAIRVLEEQHPEVEFDWNRILTTKPPAPSEVRDPREPRARRTERRPAREARRQAEIQRAEPVPEPTEDLADLGQFDETIPAELDVPLPPDAPAISAATNGETTTAFAPDLFPSQVPVATPVVPSGLVSDSSLAPARRFVRVFDAPSAPFEHRASDPSVVERMVGAEQLTVLRARYAEILARITARGGDPARVEALREQAERANPDAWVTEADVAAGLAGLEPTLADLHKIVGRRRRRRRRRPSERSGDVPAGAPGPMGGPAESAESNFPGDELHSRDDGDEPSEDEPAEGEEPES